MRDLLAAHISAKKLFGKNDRLLLAVSGGADSVVMCRLLHDAGYQIAIAHCNYRLRGRESDADERFCRSLAAALNCHFFSMHPELSARRSDQSLQEEARARRYEWFESIRQAHGFDYVLTAHHIDDQAETLLLNLVRGTGLRGMRGISEKEGSIVRPLLIFGREEIRAFARTEKIRFREDSSNRSVRYRRNFIRSKVIPLLARLNPSITRTFAENARRFSEEYRLLHASLEKESAEIIKHAGTRHSVDIAKLLDSQAPTTLLNHILSPFGFKPSQATDILQTAKGGQATGKAFFSADHWLVFDRKQLVVYPLRGEESIEINIGTLEQLKGIPFFKVERVAEAGPANGRELIVAAHRLSWPLTFRNVRKGDRIVPFGMKGSKLVSDLLREKKLNLFEKQQVKVLVDGTGELIWIPGVRSNERFRVKPADKSILKIIYIEQARNTV